MRSRSSAWWSAHACGSGCDLPGPPVLQQGDAPPASVRSQLALTMCAFAACAPHALCNPRLLAVAGQLTVAQWPNWQSFAVKVADRGCPPRVFGVPGFCCKHPQATIWVVASGWFVDEVPVKAPHHHHTTHPNKPQNTTRWPTGERSRSRLSCCCAAHTRDKKTLPHSRPRRTPPPAPAASIGESM
jgi:hypothetical protein